MYLAYVDDSGDLGTYAPGGGSLTYTLGCVLVEDSAWNGAFESLLLLRRFLNAKLGVPVRAEIKSNHLVRNGGPFHARPQSEKTRRNIYRMHLRVLPKNGLQAFAVVVDKQLCATRYPGRDPREMAWETLLQRLERTSSSWTTPFMILHDEGENDLVRKWVRKARRHLTAGSAFGTGSLTFAAKWFIDDPVPKQSHHSYFIQVADLVAYAAFRKLHASPHAKPVVPTTMWDAIGTARLSVVNYMSGGPPGIVTRP
jgi:hypothetical protein